MGAAPRRRARDSAQSAAYRPVANRQPAPGHRAHGALFAPGRDAQGGGGGPWQRPVARSAGRFVLGAAAVPTVLVAIFASVLFQSGLEFWFSNRARNMLENTVEVARSAYKYELGRVSDQAIPMAGDLTSYLQKMQIDDPQFKTGLAYQTYQRSLKKRPYCGWRPTERFKHWASLSETTESTSMRNASEPRSENSGICRKMP